MAVLLLLVIVLTSFVVVQLGAVALELTGVKDDRARFQALSAFTNSGYTTRESEEMVRHPVRRRIISVLMILGNAGMVTTVGTLASSLMVGNLITTMAKVGGILVGLLALLRLARWVGLSRRLHTAAEHWLAARYDFHAPTAEEMLRLGQGYGITRVTVAAESPAAGRPLRELGLKTRMVQVLAIERHGHFLPIPTGEDRIEAGDHVIVYGTETTIGRIFRPDLTTPLKVLDAESSAEPSTPPPPADARTRGR